MISRRSLFAFLAGAVAAITGVRRAESSEIKVNLFIYYTPQVEPYYASGKFQDAIAKIYFIEREVVYGQVESRESFEKRRKEMLAYGS